MVVVGFGDSITEAKNVPPQVHFLHRISESLGYQTVKSGVGGITSTMALARLEDDVIRHNPDICILQFGMNDHVMVGPQTPQVALSEFEDNHRLMIERLHQIGCRCVVCTIHPVISGDAKTYYYRRHPEVWYQPRGVQALIHSYNDALRGVAVECRVALADVAYRWEQYLASGGRLATALQSLQNGTVDDGVHLTEVGYGLYADCLIDILQKGLPPASNYI